MTATTRCVRCPQRFSFLFASAMFTGNETYFRNLRCAVGSREHVDATWLPIELEPGELIGKIPPFSLNYTLKNGVVTRSRIRSLEKSGRTFNAAFINHATPAAFLGSFMKRVPTVISLDATPSLLHRYGRWYEVATPESPDGLIERAKHRFVRRIYGNATALVAWSSLVRESLVNDYAVPREKISVIAPGINLRLWDPPPRGNAPHPGGRAGINVLFVGGHFMRKGGDLLLRSARREEFRDCTFHFVTRTFDGEPAANTVIHAGVEANTDELRELYRTSDVFVIPTRADFSPLAVCEAMAAGLPVIATDVGGLREIVDDGTTGFMVRPDDEAGIAARLRQLIDDRGLRLRLGAAARARAEQLFNADKNATRIVELLKSVSIAGLGEASSPAAGRRG